MPSYRLHYFPESGNSYKLALMLTLCGQSFEPIWTDFAGGVTRSAADDARPGSEGGTSGSFSCSLAGCRGRSMAKNQPKPNRSVAGLLTCQIRRRPRALKPTLTRRMRSSPPLPKRK